MKYIYPAYFVQEEGRYTVHFPDIPNICTEGDTIEEAMDMAEDALTLYLWDAEESQDTIPEASKPGTFPMPKGAFMSLIKADTLEYRKHHETQAVKKTVSIPKWLDTLGKEHNVNFSNVLQNALIKELKA